MATKAMSDDKNSATKRQISLVKSEISHLTDDTRANSMMNKGIDLAVGVMVVGLLAAFLLPIAINEIVGVDTSAWGSAETQLFNLLPIFFVLAILLYVVRRAK